MWKKGSYTLEAAFVVPIILGMVFTLMYFAMFEHDKMILQGNITNQLHRIACGETPMLNHNQWKKEISSHLWIGTMEQGEVKKQLWNIDGTGRISMEWDIPVMEIFFNKKQIYESKGEVITWQPSQMLRWKGGLPDGRN